MYKGGGTKEGRGDIENSLKRGQGGKWSEARNDPTVSEGQAGLYYARVWLASR